MREVVIRRIVLATALVPPAFLAVLVARHARNLPYWDQWVLAPFMAELAEGRLPLGTLWTQAGRRGGT